MKQLDQGVFLAYKQFKHYILILICEQDISNLTIKLIHNSKPKKLSIYYCTMINFQELSEFSNVFPSIKAFFTYLRITEQDNIQFSEEECPRLKVKFEANQQINIYQFQLVTLRSTYAQLLEYDFYQKLCNKNCLIEDPSSSCQLTFLNRLNQTLQEENQNLRMEQKRQDQMIKRLQGWNGELALKNQRMIKEIQIWNSDNDKKQDQQDQKSQYHQPIALESIRRVQNSSLICDQRQMHIEFINLDEDQSTQKIIRQTELNLHKNKFLFDSNSGNDIQSGFERKGQEIIYKKKDLKYRKYSSFRELPQPICLINFRVTKTKDHNIYLGIQLIDQAKCGATKRDLHAISYLIKGQLWENQIKAKIEAEKINQGQTLSLLINVKKGSIQWWKCGEFMIERQLPQIFRQKEVYPFITMVNQGDSIQLV